MTDRKIKKRRTQPWYEIVLKTCESLSEDYLEAKRCFKHDNDADPPDVLDMNAKLRQSVERADQALAKSLAPLLDDYSVPADKFAVIVGRVEALQGGFETKRSIQAIIELYTTAG